MVVPVMPYTITSYGRSDIGLVRQNNEDYWAELPELKVYALADGMGGHRAGEVASHETIQALLAFLEKKLSKRKNPISLEEMAEVLLAAIDQANKTVYKLSRQDAELKGMGTTLCCVQFHQKGVIFAHVGDSRIYRLRNGSLNLLTRDHSLVSDLVDLGQLDEEQAADFLYKNIITKAVGTEKQIKPTIQVSDLEGGDVFMMCSDGLSDLLELQEMESLMANDDSLEERCSSLIESAKEKGGFDNVTVVLMKVNEK